MREKDGDQQRKKKKSSQNKPDNSRNLKILAIVLIMIIGFGEYLNFSNKVPYSDKALMDVELGVNQTRLVITVVDMESSSRMKNVYFSITNPATGDRYEYRSDSIGKIYLILNNTSTINCYTRHEGYHSETLRFIFEGDNPEQVVEQRMKPYTNTRFYIQVYNQTGGFIEGARVYFDESDKPIFTDDLGLALIELDEPRTVKYTIKTNSETYSSSYEVDDYWIFERVGVFMEQ